MKVLVVVGVGIHYGLEFLSDKTWLHFVNRKRRWESIYGGGTWWWCYLFAVLRL